MIARTAQIADDQRSMIEVTSLERAGETVSLMGTAVTYEGTVLVEVVARDGTVLQATFATASAGGLERGDWALQLTLAHDAAGLVIRQEEMEEGAASASSRRLELAI